MADFIQNYGEEVSYKVDTTAWGGSPSAVSVTALDGTGDVTSRVFPTNNPSVSGDDITLSALKNLSPSSSYIIKVKFTSGGNVLIKAFGVQCT